MKYIKTISTCLLLLSIFSCSAQKKDFQKRLIYEIKLGLNCFVVVPASINNQRVDLSMEDWELKQYVQNEQAITDSLFYIQLGKAIKGQYVFILTDPQEKTKRVTVNDSIYAYVSSLGLKEVINRYVVPNYKSNIIKKDIKQEELNAVVKYFFTQNYMIKTGGFAGLYNVVPPPHKIPKYLVKEMEKSR